MREHFPFQEAHNAIVDMLHDYLAEKEHAERLETENSILMNETARLKAEAEELRLENGAFKRTVNEASAHYDNRLADIDRLKAEVERSRDQYNGIIDQQLAVIEGKQAEIDRLNTELFTCSCANANMNKHMNDNARLKAENERLRKAGDAVCESPYLWENDPAVIAWRAAKEGKPSA